MESTTRRRKTATTNQKSLSAAWGSSSLSSSRISHSEIRINEEQNRDSHGGWPLFSRSMAFFRELCSGRSPSISALQQGEKACCREESRLHSSYTAPMVLLLEDRVQLLKTIHCGPKTPEFVDKICDVYLMVFYYFNHCWLWRFAPNEVKGDIFYMLFDLGLKKYLIGNTSTLFVDETSRTRTRQFRDTIQVASILAQRDQLPAHLQDQLLAHSFLKFRIASEELLQQEIFDSLQAIRSGISHYLFYSLVEKVYLFRGVSNDMLLQLVSEMKTEYFPPKSDVIVQKEDPSVFYILVTGAMDLLVLKDGVEQVVGEAKTGDLLGEVGVLSNLSQFFTVRTRRLSQLLRLNCPAFLNILQAYDGDRSIIMNNFLQHLKEVNDPILEEALVDMEYFFARGTMNLPMCLYDKIGMNPNTTFNDGETTLHIAASMGRKSIALMLLDYGADPNIRDYDGSVPLWEAMLGGHESMSKILVENGANLQNGDVGQFACIAAEKKSLNLLKDIMQHGGDVTLPNTRSGTTALHVAVFQGNVDIVKFLVDLGADIDKPDMHGLTPRALADQQGHVDIKVLFESTGEPEAQSLLSTPEKQSEIRHIGRFRSNITPEKQSEVSYIKRYRSKIIILLLLILLILLITTVSTKLLS